MERHTKAILTVKPEVGYYSVMNGDKIIANFHATSINGSEEAEANANLFAQAGNLFAYCKDWLGHFPADVQHDLVDLLAAARGDQ